MGQVIGKHYRIDTEIGSGGMGTVYRGLDTRTEQPVAIKELKPSLVRPEHLERFRREGEALRQLNHPNIVKLLDTIEDNNSHYLIMEYVSGGDLSDLLQQGHMPVGMILRPALDLADALTRAHKLDIIHRDLKPANLLIADDGTLRLSDFGIAYMITRERITSPDLIVGTLSYLAPEVLKGELIDHRADIWAFGVILFEMLAGKHPFEADNQPALLFAILADTLPDLEALCPGAPVALIDLIYRMLAREPQERIASIRVVGAELEAILQGRGTARVTDTRFDTPTLKVITRPQHNLPAQTTPFVGREAELVQLEQLLARTQVRLVTIAAPGGMGKTRLSLEAAEHQLKHFKNGVYFVELAPLTSADGIIPAVAAATGYQFQPDERDIRQQLLDFLREKQMFLVLDNFEHLITGAGLVDDILKAAPQVKILVTSRQALNQPGETLLHLSGMDFPAWETPEDALKYAAMQLFLNSARRAQPEFELTVDNLNYVARICRLVEGMPLGIVLAASWLALLSPAEIAAEMQQSLDFLEAQGSEVPVRQRSIRAVFDYSWQMLDADEQQVFMRLSVFQGGFTRQAAQTVTGATLRVLMSLVNKSLLRRDVEKGRYSIHELLRQYAGEHLNTSGHADSVQDAHSAHYMAQLHTRHKEFEGPGAFKLLHDIRDDSENIVRAMQWAAEHGRFVRLDNALHTFWFYYQVRGDYLAGETVFTLLVQTLTQHPADPERNQALAHALLRLASLTYAAGPDEQVDKHFVRGKSLVTPESSLELQAVCALLTGREKQQKWAIPDARMHYEEALRLYRQAGDGLGEVEALRRIAYTWVINELHEVPDWEKSRATTMEACEIEQKRGGFITLHWTYEGLGFIALNTDTPLEDGIAILRQGVAHSERLENQYMIADLMADLGNMLGYAGQYDEGLQYLETSLRIRENLGRPKLVAHTLVKIIGLYNSQGQYATARDIVQRGLDVTRNVYSRWYRNFHFMQATLAEAIGEYDEATGWIQGYMAGNLPPEEADVILFKSNLHLAFLAACQERWNDVAVPAERAQQHAQKMGNPEFTHGYHIIMTWIEYRRGEYPAAEQHIRIPLNYLRTRKERREQESLQEVVAVLALVLTARGNMTEAHACALESLHLTGKKQDVRMMSMALLAAGALLLAEGKITQTVRVAALEAYDVRFPYYQRELDLRTLNQARVQLNAAAFQAGIEAGQTLHIETIVSELLEEFKVTPGEG